MKHVTDGVNTISIFFYCNFIKITDFVTIVLLLMVHFDVSLNQYSIEYFQ